MVVPLLRYGEDTVVQGNVARFLVLFDDNLRVGSQVTMGRGCVSWWHSSEGKSMPMWAKVVGKI